MLPEESEELIQRLQNTSNFRVLRKLPCPREYNRSNRAETKIAVYLDLETTGLNFRNAEIIEIGLVPFRYSSDGKIFEVLEAYNGLQQPKAGSIPEETTRITGITNEMVRGQSIDTDKVSKIVSAASLIIAHNANFDRKFAETEFEIFSSKAWACSMSQIPWREEGLEGAKLEYLAMKHGFFYDAHRATTDCYAGLELLSRHLPKSNRPTFGVLLDEARKNTKRIWAERAPFDLKDVLKERGYRWNDGNDGRPKAWYIDVIDSEFKDEISFLSKEIYMREVDLPVTTITAMERFSSRV